MLKVGLRFDKDQSKSYSGIIEIPFTACRHGTHLDQISLVVVAAVDAEAGGQLHEEPHPGVVGFPGGGCGSAESRVPLAGRERQQLGTDAKHGGVAGQTAGAVGGTQGRAHEPHSIGHRRHWHVDVL